MQPVSRQLAPMVLRVQEHPPVGVPTPSDARCRNSDIERDSAHGGGGWTTGREGATSTMNMAVWVTQAAP
jgi:hypothetical protein